uniref:Ig-like domain-containing protein n=1 Tax=Oncorhynchus mykiss TaxID=8022 RepID=A0A8K9XSA9_ONCMY
NARPIVRRPMDLPVAAGCDRAWARTQRDTRVDFNADASYTCTHADPTGVLQVTWQRLFKDDSVENLATYSKRFGAQIIDPQRGKVVFTEASLNSTSITVKNVTWADDACYICSFNVYPSGSIRKQICLTVQGYEILPEIDM